MSNIWTQVMGYEWYPRPLRMTEEEEIKFRINKPFNGWAPEYKLKSSNMEKVSVSKELMQDVHAGLKKECWTHLVHRIESELPELFKPKFEVGQWVCGDCERIQLGRIIQIVKAGFKVDNIDYDHPGACENWGDAVTPATGKEVENHLCRLLDDKINKM